MYNTVIAQAARTATNHIFCRVKGTAAVTTYNSIPSVDAGRIPRYMIMQVAPLLLYMGCRSTGLSNASQHLPQVLPSVVETTVPHLHLYCPVIEHSSEPTICLGRLFKFTVYLENTWNSLPSKYWPSSTLLDSSARTKSGISKLMILPDTYFVSFQGCSCSCSREYINDVHCLCDIPT